MTTIELLAAPPATKDAAALLERLERLRDRHWQELNNEGCYLLTLVRRAWEREERNREIDQMIGSGDPALDGCREFPR